MGFQRRWTVTGAAAAVVVALAGMSGCASQGPTAPGGIEQKIVNAHTRADHEELAGLFEKQSADDKAAAEKHRGYARSYRSNRSLRSGNQANLAAHCERLATQYEQAASENVELAKAHRDMGAEIK